MQVRPQFIQRQPPAKGNRVVHQVQRVIREIDHRPSIGALDPGPVHVPFPGYFPVEQRRTGRHFAALEGDNLSQTIQGLPHPVACDTAADREEFSQQGEGLLGEWLTVPSILWRDEVLLSARAHGHFTSHQP
jgi:hypothetical protein